MAEKSKKEVEPQAREFFDKGLVALRKENLEYATKLFEQALRREDPTRAGRAAQSISTPP